MMTSEIDGNAAESRLQQSLTALRREIALQINEGLSGGDSKETVPATGESPDSKRGNFEYTVRWAMGRLGELFGIGR